MNQRQQRARQDLVRDFPLLVAAAGPAAEEFRIVEKSTTAPTRKTWAMRVAESALGQPIEQILSRDKRGADIARQLGIGPDCVSKWRRALGI